MRVSGSALTLALFSALPLQAQQESGAEQLAQELANPVASLISAPIQTNTDFGIGPNNGSRFVTNVQPVIPFSLGEDFNLITRWIVPVVAQRDIFGEGTSQTGLSDALISAFVSPVGGSFIWGVGPALLVPIATDEALGTEKFGLGPSAVALAQEGNWTYGALVNHLWSVAGDDERSDVNQSFFQPFVVYNWPSGAGVTLQGEFTQNWEAETTVFVLNPTASAVTTLGSQTVSFAIGPRIHFGDNRADFGMRAVLTLVFPKG